VDQRTENRVTTDSTHPIVLSLARELDLPPEHVARVYRDEASRIEAGARIKTFVSVIVASRVRAELRRQQSSR